MTRSDLQKLLLEFESRKEFCFFPERCFESSDWDNVTIPPADTFHFPGTREYLIRTVGYDPSRNFKKGVRIANWNDQKGGGVVSLVYMLDKDINGLGKDSKKVLWNEFSEINPDLKLVGLWTQIALSGYPTSVLVVHLQYSPVKAKNC